MRKILTIVALGFTALTDSSTKGELQQKLWKTGLHSYIETYDSLEH